MRVGGNIGRLRIRDTVRKVTLVTGVVLLLIGGVFSGYLVYEYTSPTYFEHSHYLGVAFIRSFGDWTVHLDWAAMPTNTSNSTAPPYVFYVTLAKPTSCSNLTRVIASQSGVSGSVTVEVGGNVRWYAVICDSARDRVPLGVSVWALGFSYYMVTGIGLTILGAAVTVVSFFQTSSPPLLSAPPRNPPVYKPPPGT